MVIRKIKKRDGRLEDFDHKRIATAVFKAAKSLGGSDWAAAEKVTDQAVAELERRFPDGAPGVEDVQDAVEKALIETGHAKTAKAYILYRKQHADIRSIRALLESTEMVEDYLGLADWRVKENANMSYSLQGLNFHISSAIVSEYWLNKIYTETVGAAHKSGDFHVHDLGILGPYCVGWDLKDLLLTGFGHVPGKIASKPAKHLRTALGQIVNFFYTLQGEAAGAQAFSNFDTYLAPFIRYDNLDYAQVKQALQEFVFNINVPTRVGFQTPFTNITMDLLVPGMMKNEPVIVGGKLMDATYGDFQKELDVFNTAFAEVMMEGDANGRVFTFPIPTYNITKDFDWDNPVVENVFRMTAKYGVPYFSNFINSDMSPEDARSMCLHGDEEIIYRKNGGIQTGRMEDFVQENAFEFDQEGWAKPANRVEVASLNPKTNKMQWKAVRQFTRVKRRESVQMQAQDGRGFTASTNHVVSVVTPDGLQEKLAQDVQVGDYILSLKKGSALLSEKYVRIDGLDLDEELAYLAGFFTADGNFLWDNKNGRKTRGIQLSFNTQSKSLINRLRNRLERAFGIKARIKKDPRYNTTYVYLYNQAVAKFIYEAGFKKKGRLPDALFNSPKRVIESFLEGFFEGDGHAARGEIHINDEELARHLTLLYGLTDRPTTFRKRTNSQVVYLQQKESEINKAGILSTPCLYECVPGFMAKSTYAVPGLSKNRLVGLKTLQKYAAHTGESLKWAQGDVYPVRVTSVSLSSHDKEQAFYDVELEENHLFLHSLGTITHNCCRLRLDNRELRKRGGGLFGANPLTGSVGVVTINLPRIGFTAKTEAEYFRQLDVLMDLARDSLETKRKVLEEFTDRGLYPYSKYYLRDIKTAFGAYWKNHFATIGLIGLNESIENFLGVSIADVQGKAFGIRVLEHMRDRLGGYQAETGNIYNLEATPGEGTSYRLARLDVKTHPAIHVANTEAAAKGAAPYYTNSSHLPVGHTKDIFEALEHQDDLQRQYTGGTVLHGFVGERISDWRTARELVKKIASNFRLPYFTLTPTFSVCPKHGYLAGEHAYCPRCDEEIGYVKIEGLDTTESQSRQTPVSAPSGT